MAVEAKVKNKYIKYFSPILLQETKHQLLGEPFETENGMMQLIKCLRTRHISTINLDEIELSDTLKNRKPNGISKEDAEVYSPLNEYPLGSIIYHEKWDDIGIVNAKEILSSGQHAIVVNFEKSKEKRLVEKLKN